MLLRVLPRRFLRGKTSAREGLDTTSQELEFLTALYFLLRLSRCTSPSLMSSFIAHNAWVFVNPLLETKSRSLASSQAFKIFLTFSKYSGLAGKVLKVCVVFFIIIKSFKKKLEPMVKNC